MRNARLQGPVPEYGQARRVFEAYSKTVRTSFDVEADDDDDDDGGGGGGYCQEIVTKNAMSRPCHTNVTLL